MMYCIDYSIELRKFSFSIAFPSCRSHGFLKVKVVFVLLEQFKVESFQ